MRFIDVPTGEVGFAQGKGQLAASAIGSCIAVAMHDNLLRAGGIAHIMLPGKAPSDIIDDQQYKYARNGIGYLLNKLKTTGSKEERINVYAAGGGNVMERQDDTICANNIESVLNVIAELNLVLSARMLGGNMRRRVRLDVATGHFYCGVGDGAEVLINAK